MKHSFLLCPFDGFKLRIYSTSYIDYMLCNAGKYNLVGLKPLYAEDDTDYPTGKYSDKVFDPILGKYKGFSIKIGTTCKGRAVEIQGSFHKFFYKGENYQPFYWEDFIEVYKQLIQMFALDPKDVNVVNLEVGVNVYTLPQWLATAKDICSIILYFNPPSKRSARDVKEYKGFGFSWCAMHEQFWLKIYDKLPILGEKTRDIIRLEKKHKKRGPLKKLGVTNLESLLDQAVLVKLNKNLIKTLGKLIIYQGELDDCESLPEEVKTFLLHYRKAEAWTAVYRADKALFKKVKLKYYSILKRYTSFNLKEELLKEAARLLFEIKQ